ncbi:FYVE and coiled-coil domain-containing protein 1-like [Ptychodera flava]|uniref:FYVE and coiled-coil domain-containing protein 1-like n=1 Tax=Ptychodera flava TaxID=63121 RepID=UPI00396A8786
MAESQHPKIIQDLKECIQELKRDYRDSQIPITDDNTTLHKLCAKLELLLRTNRKEKSSLLGGKKDFWDYFYSSLYKVKGLNEGIRFVKSMPELRTSLGKGRAFIRYSLVQQRLADTMQQCVMNGKVTSDWYTPKSVLLNHKHSSALVSDMYDLNEIQFDLSPTGYDLDSSWPTFARKSFGTSAHGLWQAPSRSSSISSLTSYTSQQNDSFAPGSPHSSLKQTIDEEKYSALQIELDQSEINIQQLQQRNEQLETEREEMKLLALDTETRLADVTSQFQKKIQEMEYQVSRAASDLEEKRKLWNEEKDSLRSRLEDAESMNSDLYVRIDALNKQHQSREKVFADIENDLKERLKATDESNVELSVESKGLKQQLEIIENEMKKKQEQMKEVEEKLLSSESKQQDLIARMEGLVNEKDVKASDHFDSANKAHELVGKMMETEKLNVELKGQNDEMNRQLKILQDRITEMESTNRDQMKLLQNQLEEKEKSLSQLNEELRAKLEEAEKLQGDMRIENQNLTESSEKLQKIVDAKDEELETVKLEMQASADLSRKTLEELNGKIGELQTELESNRSSSASEVERLTARVAELEERNNKTSPLCEESPIEVTVGKVVESDMQMSCDETDSGSTHFKISNDELTENLSVKEAELQRVKSELDELRTLIDSAHAEGSESELQQLSENVHESNQQTADRLLSSIIELHKLHDAQKTLESNNAELKNGIKELEQTCNKYRDELEESNTKIKDLNTHVSQMEKSEISLQTTLQEKTTEFEELQEKYQALEIDKQSLEKRTVELQEIASTKESKITELERQYEELEKAMSDISIENDCLKKEKDEMNERMASQEREVAEKVIKKDAELVELMEREEEFQTELRESRLYREKIEAEQLQQTGKLQQTENELKSQQQRFVEEKTALEEQVESLREACEEERLNTQKLQVTLEDLRRVHEENLSQEQVFEERKQQISKEYEDKVTFLKQQFKSIKDDIQTELDSKSSELEQLKEQFDLLLKEKNEISDKNDLLNSQISDVNEQCEVLRRERSEIEEKLEQNNADAAIKIAEVKLETDELVQNLNTVTLERDDLHRQLTSLQKSTAETDDLLKSKDEKIQAMQEEANDVKATMETEISSLQFQLSSETMQYQQQINAYAGQAIEMVAMRDKVAENEQLLAHLGETLETTKKEWKQESEALSKDLKKKTAILSAKEEECKNLHSEIDKITSKLEEEKRATKEEQGKVKKYELELENFEKKKEEEMSQLESDNEELKKRLIKLIRDKDNLWQKTDWLAHQQKLQAAERWLDDKEVNNCMQCQTEFSLTVRRHHCRLCGRIFCHNCSNNWIMTKHSSKKSRACLTCFAKFQHQQEGGIMDTSVVDNSDEEIDPAILKGRFGRFGSQSETSSTATSPDEEYSRSNSRNSFVTASSGVMSPLSDDAKDITKSTSHNSLAEMDEEVTTETDGEQSQSASSLLHEGRKVNPGATAVMTTGDDSMTTETAHEADSSRDDVFDVIGEDEIALSKEAEVEDNNETKEQAENKSTLGNSLEVKEESLTSSLVMSAEQLESFSEESYEEWIKAGKSYAVPVKVDKPGVVLCWEFSTEPKDIAFSVTYKESEETILKESQVLIPLFRCNSHRQSVQGELIAKQAGIYTLIFDNSFSRFTSKKARYKLQIKRPGP